MGVVGEKGKCCHIMYSDRPNGVPMYEKARSTTKYQGVYIDEKSDKSKKPEDYEWFLFNKKNV